MGFENIVFYVFAGIMVFSALMVITVKNPVQAALFLVLTFFSCAAIWMLLEAEFLAIALVLVYVGAVMVLFLFVVMMLDINVARMRAAFMQYLPIGIAVLVTMAVMMFMVVNQIHIDAPGRAAANYNNTRELGLVLYTVYVYPFEIAAVILLVAIIAAIALTLRRRPNTKHQNPDLQIAVKRDDRIRMVKMDTEEKK
ncbi:MAG: NADH-quinone oxidoreductase subunit J [Gammaproteobacteria bacterium]|nr:NADH-quinone oxidoreductase subunit J [Gammaproteobacteria bacterium]MCW8987889.1 NADH-quinone oxidoreductase subunit J [Gammaproteobacteria bacterium]MCW9031219.1 NADH-quinone oxidoreductase subunit J [Gammaproteobacteria bacterium]